MSAPTRLGHEHVAPLVLVNLGVALHATIWFMASTVMPSVVADLGAAAFISWATSVYLVTMILGGAAMAPAKARWGARGAMLLASLIVAAGSALGATATSMNLVLAARALQGLGEGLMVALSYALVRELFTNALVPKVFGVQAATWGVSIFLGPALGGWLTEAFSWRAAFVASALMPLPVMALAWRVLHTSPPREGPTPTAPWLRLGLLAAAVMAITASNRVATITLGVACVAGGLALIASVLLADRRRAPHLFPTAFPGLRHPVSLGLWVAMLMPLAQAPVYVFVPYILQMHRGLSPTMAGYYGATHAMAWCVAAILAPMFSPRWQSRSFVLGPLLLSAGLAGTAICAAAPAGAVAHLYRRGLRHLQHVCQPGYPVACPAGTGRRDVRRHSHAGWPGWRDQRSACGPDRQRCRPRGVARHRAHSACHAVDVWRGRRAGPVVRGSGVAAAVDIGERTFLPFDARAERRISMKTSNPLIPPLEVSRWFNTGEPLSLNDLRGQVVVIHAFQMLCPACVSHGLPQASRMREVFAPEELVVIGLHCVFEHHAVMGAAALEAFIHEYRLRFPIGIDAPAPQGPLPRTMAAWGLEGTPSLVLLDRSGQPVLKHFGSIDDMVLGGLIGRLIAAQPPSENAAPSMRGATTDQGVCGPDACSVATL